VFLVNSRLESFAAGSIPFSKKKDKTEVYPEVTPAVLPSSLAEVISIALVFSTHPPALVCGTVTYISHYRGFSWQPKSLESLALRQAIYITTCEL
jgi:hypothetical protein